LPVWRDAKVGNYNRDEEKGKRRKKKEKKRTSAFSTYCALSLIAINKVANDDSQVSLYWILYYY
jgi:hypothetical protein